MKKDITTKETIKIITQDISKYILGLNVTDIKFIDKELQRIEKREADIVALCKINGIKSILHIEIQNNNDKTMHNRMLRYYTDIKFRYDNLPLHQYMIYIGKAKLSMKDKITEDNINYKYSIINMHKIDCQKFLKMDTPDALVLAILCDFKDRDKSEVITYIIQRLNELTKDNQHQQDKYMVILETLSTNRDLKDSVKEIEEMLRTIDVTKMPSYGRYIKSKKLFEEGRAEGLSQGLSQGTIKTAITMIKEFDLSIKEVSNKLNIPLNELEKHLKN